MLPHARRMASLALAALLMAPFSVVKGQTSSAPRVQAIRFWSFADVTRIAIQTDGQYKLKSDQIDNPPRLFFDLNGLRPPSSAHRGVETIQVADHRVKEIRVAQVSPGTTRIVFDLEAQAEVVSSQLVNPDRLIIEIRPRQAKPAVLPPVVAATIPPPPQVSIVPHVDSPTPGINALLESKTDKTRPPIPQPSAAIKAPGLASPAKKDREGDRSLVRVFGLKLGKVVIDAGHGGHDTGTIGHGGLLEKDLVLDVALRLGTLISRQLGAEVVYTRSDDVFIPLEDRTKIANDQKADLFISIHANSSPERTATGVETYYFNLNSDKAGLDLATRENSTAASSISDLNDMLHRAVLQTKLEESRDFAQRVQTSLCSMSARMNNRSKDRGVRQAPFVVLIGATMPSILAEIGFVSNPHDERLMRRNDQRQKIADALFKGVSQYANSLSHLQLARAGSQ